MFNKNGRNAFDIQIQKKNAETIGKRAVMLFWMQVTLIALLCFTLILVHILDRSNRRILYLTIVAGLALLIGMALAYNFSGKYKASSWLTVIAVSLGPWASIILDNAILKGDFIPLVYIVLSIQLCSIFLSVRATLVISVFQLTSLLALILLIPNHIKINWPSLFCFLLITSALGIVSSLVTRKQMEQIEQQKCQLQEDEKRLREISIMDHLTGLYNRRFMEEFLERQIIMAMSDRQSVGILMVDIDEFKRINDTYGHTIGDSILLQTANILSSGIRNSDVLCRFGGDEFIMIMPGCTVTDITKRAEGLREVINNTVLKHEGKDLGQVTLSIGVAAYPENGFCGDAVIKAADEALYAAKNEGRNKVVAAGSVRIASNYVKGNTEVHCDADQ